LTASAPVGFWFVGGIVVFIDAGWEFLPVSLAQIEHSSISADGTPISQCQAITPSCSSAALD